MNKLKQLNNERCSEHEMLKQKTMSLYEKLEVRREKKCIEKTDASLDGQIEKRNSFTKEKTETCDRWRIPMKKSVLLTMIMLIAIMLNLNIGKTLAATEDEKAFIFEVYIDQQQWIDLNIPVYDKATLESISNNYTIDWGDGTVNKYTTEEVISHTYKENNTTYTIKISGQITIVGDYDETITDRITKIVQWGELGAKKYSFFGSVNLGGTIPEPSQNSFKNLTSTDGMFEDCINLSGEIPETLFENANEIDNFGSAFSNCVNLTGTIPENLFANNEKARYFNGIFSGCKGLTGSIPENLFVKNINAKLFNNVFSGCTGLKGAIPENLFSKNTNASNFSYVFENCTGLTGTIPENLFAQNINASNFSSTFKNCTGLTGSIPENLFIKNTSVTEFYSTFEGCIGLKGSIPENLFLNISNVKSYARMFKDCSGLTGKISTSLFSNNNNTKEQNISYLYYYQPEYYWNSLYGEMFANCSGITELEINTEHIGYKMFYNCNNITKILIGENVEQIGTMAFYVSSPYNEENLLITNLISNNQIALTYNWLDDYRNCSKNTILIEPQDIISEKNSDVTLNVKVSGDDLNYKWYECANNNRFDLENGIYRSKINGMANTISSSEIKINTQYTGIVSFAYMVSSEENNDIFTITITDANGTTIVADGISGEVGWTKFEMECTATEDDEILIELVYKKNESIDEGADLGAIRNLEFFEYVEKSLEFNKINTSSFGAGDTNNYLQAYDVNNATHTAELSIPLENEVTLTLNYSVYPNVYKYSDCEKSAKISIRDYNGIRTVVNETSTEKGSLSGTYSEKVTPNNYGYVYVTIKLYAGSGGSSTLFVSGNTSYNQNMISTFENDSKFEFIENGWEKVDYVGTDTAMLTIPGTLVNSAVNRSKYYCEISDLSGISTTREALLTIAPKGFITTWNVPVKEAEGTTSVIAPILANDSDYYTIYWGDGRHSTYTGRSFPSHIYTNTEDTTYEIKIVGNISAFGYNSLEVPTESNTQSIYWTFTQYLTGIKQWGYIGATQYGFANCINLIGKIPLPSEDIFADVTSFAYIFSNCSGLTSSELNFDTTNITNTNYMLAGCTGIKTLVLGDNFKKLDGTGMFNGCTNLNAIILLNNAESTSDVATLGSTATIALPSNTVIYVPNPEAEMAYANVWSGLIDKEQLEPILALIGEDEIFLNSGETYTEEGYTVAGYTEDEALEYEQLGYSVTTTESAPIDSAGSFERIHTLYKAGEEVEAAAYSLARTTSTTEEIDSVTRIINYNTIGIYDAEITLSGDKFTHDGTAKEPEVTVTLSGDELVEGTHYTKAYINNVEVGTASVIITGINQYSGTVTKNFVINSGIQNDEFIVDTAGPEISNITTVISEDVTTVTVTADITDPDVSGDKDLGNMLEGSGVNDSETRYAITATETAPAADSTAWQASNILDTIDVENAYVWVKAVDNVGNISIASTSVILEVAMEDIKISVTSGSLEYDGTAKTVTVVVEDGETLLEEGKHYTISYENHIDAGTANVIITGKNIYTGTVTKEFNIAAKPITVQWTNTELTYNGKAQVPTASVETGVSGETINLVESGEQINVGKNYQASVDLTLSTVTGNRGKLSNYDLKDQTTLFNISLDDNLKFNVTLNNDTFEYDGTSHTPEVTVKVTLDGEEVPLGSGDDYTVEYDNNTNVSTETTKPTITITGKGNYEGISKVVEFEITPKKITITPNPNQFKVYGDADPDKLTYADSGAILNQTPEFSGDLIRATGEDVGEYLITLGSLELVDKDAFIANNYVLELDSTPVNFNITAKPIKVVWSNTTLLYDGGPKVPTAADIVGVNGETVKLSVSGAQTAIGKGYTATASIASVIKADGTAGNVNNYTLTDATTTFDILLGNYSDGTNTYETLAEAFNNAEDRATITVIQDVNPDNSNAIVPEGKTFTLNTDGKTITKEAYGITVSEGSTLTIDGGGTITGGTNCNTLGNNGIVNIYDVTVRNWSSSNSYKTIINNTTGTINVYDGLITSYCWTVDNYGDLNIYGGHIKAEGTVDEDYIRTVYIRENSSITVDGGTVSANNNSTATTSTARAIIGLGNVKVSSGVVKSTGYSSRAIEIHAYEDITSQFVISGSATITATSEVDGGNAKGVYIYADDNVEMNTLINILGGNITAQGDDVANTQALCIIKDSAETVITGGNINSNGIGVKIIDSLGELTIGNPDDTLTSTSPSPSITGDTYSIYAPNGFNFYNGILKSTDESVFRGDVIDTREGHGIKYSTEEKDNTTYHTAVVALFEQPSAPTITSTVVADTWSNATAVVTLISGDTIPVGGQTLQYKINDGEWTNYTEEITIDTEGITTVTARAINTSSPDDTSLISSETTYIVKVDTNKPEVTVNDTTYGSKANITLTDSLSGVVGYIVSKTNETPDATSEWVEVGSTTNTTIEYTPEKATTYYVWAIDESGNISDVVEFNVAPRNISDATIQLGRTEYIYDGEGKTPTVVVTIDGNPLTKTEYTVTYINNVNVGSATDEVVANRPTVRIEGQGNYTGTVEKYFTIKSANLDIRVAGYSEMYDGLAHGVTLSGDDIQGADVVITYSLDDITYSETAPMFKNVGTNTVYVKVEKPGYNTFTTNVIVEIKVREIEVVWGNTDLIYTAKPQKPTAEAPTGVSGETIELAITGEATDVGTNYMAEIDLTATEITGENADLNNYKLTNTTTPFTISLAANTEFKVTLSGDSFEYTGYEQTPEITVTVMIDGVETELEKDKEYRIEYTNRKDVGDVKVTIIGLGMYETVPSVEEEFKITAKELVITPKAGQSKAYAEADPQLAYMVTGYVAAEEGLFSGDLTREPGEDVGTYRILLGTLTPMEKDAFKPSNYYVTFTEGVTFEITIVDISTGTVNVIPPEMEYDGTSKTPDTEVIVNGRTLIRDTDYIVKYANNTEIGTADVRIEGIRNYTGVLETAFEIVKPQISSATITLKPSRDVYDGTEKRPEVIATYKGNSLTKNVDFEVTYYNNINAGEAYAIIKGIGSYDGEVKKIYIIDPKQLDGSILIPKDTYEATGAAIRPSVTFVTPEGKELEIGVDYTVNYENNVNIGTAEIIVTGIGNYTGKVSRTFTIEKPYIKMTLKDKYALYTGNGIAIDEVEFENVEEDLSGYVEYKYYTSDQTEVDGLPIDKGVYYVEATIGELSNYKASRSNVAKLVIHGAPNKPELIGESNGILYESGVASSDTIKVRVYGGQVENAPDMELGYKYSLDGITWQEYTSEIEVTEEGKTKIYAKAYIKGNTEATAESEVAEYIAVINKTAPVIDTIKIPEVIDSVVTEIEISGDTVEKAFITEDSSIDPSKPEYSGDWLDIGETGKTIIELSQGDGEKTVYVWVKDAIGNITGPVAAKTRLNALKIGNMGTNKTTIMFKVTDAYMKEANITENDIEIYVNDILSSGRITGITKEEIMGGYKFTAIMEDVNGNGELSMSLINGTVYDKAGNYLNVDNNKLYTNEITVDNILPKVSVSRDENTAYIVAEDEHVKAVMVNGEIIGTANGVYTIDLRSGNNKIVVIDEYGNEVVVEISYEIRVEYDANMGENAPATQIKTEGVPLKLTDDIPTRWGYTFQGWGSSYDTKVAAYQPGDVYTNDWSTVLYAIWKPLEYNIVYDANQGINPPEAQIKIHDEPITLRAEEPYRDGHIFKGWAVSKADADALTPTYQPGDEYVAEGHATLYAVWQIITYPVTYNANADNVNGLPADQIKIWGTTLTLDPNSPTREGYKFMGWGLSSGATVAAYQPGDEYIANAALDLYAIFFPIIRGDLSIAGTLTYKETLTANITDLWPADTNLTYQWYTNTSESTSGGTPISGANGNTYTIGSGLAGKYIYVVVEGTGTNYISTTFKDLADSTNNGSGKVSKISLTKPTASTTTFTYNGSAKTLTLSSSYDSTLMTVENHSKTDAGSYTATISLRDPNNYQWSDGTTTNVSISWKINKASLTKPTASTTTFTYNGSAKTLTLSNYDSTLMTVENHSKTAAGSYTATISLKDTNNYQWSDGTTTNVSISWKINKASLTKPTATKTEFEYDGNAKTVPLSSSYNSTLMNVTNRTKTAVGNYTATISLRDPNNYQWSDGTTTNISISWKIVESAYVSMMERTIHYFYNYRNEVLTSNSISFDWYTDWGYYEKINIPIRKLTVGKSYTITFNESSWGVNSHDYAYGCKVSDAKELEEWDIIHGLQWSKSSFSSSTRSGSVTFTATATTMYWNWDFTRQENYEDAGVSIWNIAIKQN